MPRALWWGLEWVRFALSEVWHVPQSEPPRLRGHNVQRSFDEQLRAIPKPLKKKLKYYRNYLKPGIRQVSLRGYYSRAQFDGQKEVYRDVVAQWAAVAARAQRARAVPAPEDIGMQEYLSHQTLSINMDLEGLEE